jgi:hypothetical protein
MLQPRLGRWSAPTAPGEDRVHRVAQIASGHRRAVPWPTAVELTAIDELPIAPEEEEVRRAGGAIGFATAWVSS